MRIVLLLIVVCLSALSQQNVGHKGEHQLQMEQQRALELINDSTITEFKQGIDLVRSGMYKEAVSLFAAIAKRHQRNSVAFYDLGVTYKFLNNYTQALRMLQRACKLKKDPRYSEQLNAVKRLDAVRKRSR